MYNNEILRSADVRYTLDGELGGEHWCLIHTSGRAKLLRDVDVIIGRCGGCTERKSGRDDGRNGSFVHDGFCFSIATMLAAAWG